MKRTLLMALAAPIFLLPSGCAPSQSASAVATSETWKDQAPTHPLDPLTYGEIQVGHRGAAGCRPF